MLIKVPIIKFHGNSSSGDHADICGQMDRPADMTKLIDSFSYYVNAPKTGQANLQISFSV